MRRGSLAEQQPNDRIIDKWFDYDHESKRPGRLPDATRPIRSWESEADVREPTVVPIPLEYHAELPRSDRSGRSLHSERRRSV